MPPRTSMMDKANRLLPLLVVAVGAIATWTSVQMRVDTVEHKLQEHLGDWDHDPWFSATGIQHPALRGCLERYVDEQLHVAVEASRVRIMSERDEIWRRFYKANIGKIVEP
jgi:hypothetical protein